MSLLQMENVNSYYGAAHALHDFNLSIKEGEIISLLGRNGVGKSTTLKSIMGMLTVKGDVIFDGEKLTNLPTSKIARKGIGLVPEERRIFSNLTVKENLLVGVSRKGVWNLERVYELFPVLKEKQNRMGTLLSGGEQQMLAIARSIMSNPKLILLDEPCEGLAPVIVNELKKGIAKLKEEGMTIIIAEQSLRISKVLATRHYLISKGEVCFEGSSDQLFNSPDILIKYLGVQ